MALFALACATSDPTRTLADRLRGAAPGVPAKASVLAIDASSEDAAWGRVVRARTETPLEESRLLAALFEGSAVERVEIVAGGPYPALTDRVILDAFILAERSDLSAVHLVHVGPEAPTRELLAACAGRGARCDHVPWSALD